MYGNGALDPDLWKPIYANLHAGVAARRVQVGDLVGWRYGAWRAIEVTPVPDVDLTEEDRAIMDRVVSGLRSEEDRHRVRAHGRPLYVVLAHESGPLITKAGERFPRLHDGRVTMHLGTQPMSNPFNILMEPYQTCSCHGHIWRCQDMDRDAVAAAGAATMRQVEDGHAPGVCLACREPITTRQKSLTFPEPSRVLPGAPGPTFHAGRSSCWAAAEEYERTGRLVDNPDVARLASCPGVRFIHEDHAMPAAQRIECTAGPACTGLHGPAGYQRESPCWYRDPITGNAGAYPRPERDCGYTRGDRRCLAADLSGGAGAINPIAADLLWENRHRNRRI